MHLASLLTTLALACFTVKALADCTIPFQAEAKEEGSFEAAIRHKLLRKEDFDFKDEKHDEYEEGGVKGKIYLYRAATGRFV
ncbi:hypothetical protein JCM11251_005790 [Rhodosporidiobolus azoricus]